MASLVNDGTNFSGKTITLEANILLNDTTANGGWENWDETTTGLIEWIAMGNYNSQFSGTFDGNYHVVSGVYINTASDYQGLFGYVTSEGTIKNIGVEASHIKGGNCVGGLVGFINNHSAIINSYTTGTVSGNSSVGGLVGRNYYGTYGIIRSSYATGAVSGNNSVGGLVGENYFGNISNSYATGAVSGGSDVGGLVGGNFSNSTINNSYATGTVSSNSYDVGGLVGRNSYGAISNSYYDKETSKQSDTDKGDGKTTAEMQSKDFVDILNIGSINVWIYSEDGYPILSKETPKISNYFESGDGTLENPYNIKTKEQLKDFSLLVRLGITFSSEYIKLGNDIVLNDTTGWQNWENNPPTNVWVAIGESSNQFSGTFDGNGHIVSGVFYIHAINNYQGLFGFVGSTGTIKNLGVEASYINGGRCVGVLVGANNGIISNSYAKGTAKGTSGYAGGFVGYNSNGIISNSYATGVVNGSSFIGGLVGYNEYGAISNSYAAGAVTGNDRTGGLVGYSGGTISNSYAIATVIGIDEYYYIGGLVGANNGAISNSYYDKETSGQSDTGKGESKTTAEMKQQATFEDWDFEDTWNIIEGVAYPYLKSQSIEEDDPTLLLLPQIASGQIRVQAINGGILLENLPTNAKVELYNLQGKQVYSAISVEAKCIVPLQAKGIYIVKAGTQKFSVVFR